MKRKIAFLFINIFLMIPTFSKAVLYGQKVIHNGDLISFFNSDGTENKVLEPSAVQAINERYLLVADDKLANLLIVEAASGKIVKPLSIPGFTIEKPKWEAMTSDGQFFYIIGSHAVKTDDPSKKLAARSHLLRFKLTNVDGDVSKIEIDSVNELDIKASLSKLALYNPDPKDNSVKIEGLAVRSKDSKNELFFALREPHNAMWVFSSEIASNPKPNEELNLRLSFSFDAGTVGLVPLRLSSMEYIPQLDGFLVITSTEDEKNSFFGNALWFVQNASIRNYQPWKPVSASRLWFFDQQMKAEGICLLPGSTGEKTRLAIVYDNDAEDTQKTGRMRIIELSKGQ